MKTFHTSILKKRQSAETIVFVTLLVLALSLTMALGQEAPGGYLARGLGGFKLGEAPPPKRPTKPLPPLPIVYNPQPGRSGPALPSGSPSGRTDSRHAAGSTRPALAHRRPEQTAQPAPG